MASKAQPTSGFIPPLTISTPVDLPPLRPALTIAKASPLATTRPIPPLYGTNGISPRPFIDLDDLHWTIYETISSIQDPEFNKTLEELEVLSQESLIIHDRYNPPPQIGLVDYYTDDDDLTTPPTTSDSMSTTPPPPLTTQSITPPPPQVKYPSTDSLVIQVTFRPTVPHCSYASQIGLSIIYAIYDVLADFNFKPPIPTHFLTRKSEKTNNGTTDPGGGGDTDDERDFSELLSKSKFVKVIVLLEKGSHQTEADLNKQFNDKERVCAAFENPKLLELVRKLCRFRNV